MTSFYVQTHEFAMQIGYETVKDFTPYFLLADFTFPINSIFQAHSFLFDYYFSNHSFPEMIPADQTICTGLYRFNRNSFLRSWLKLDAQC